MAKEMDIKFAITSSAIKALDYKKNKPNANIEEIMGVIFTNARGSSDVKKGVVVGVSKAIKYLEANPSATTKGIMQQIMNELDEIVFSLNDRE
jgi:hypothetical protein